MLGPAPRSRISSPAALATLLSAVLAQLLFSPSRNLDLVARAQLDGRLRLVVSDLAMPTMGGRELGNRLREQGHRVPLLFITGYPERDVERLGLLDTDQEVLGKPFTPEAPVERARQLAAGECRFCRLLPECRPAIFGSSP